VVKIGYHTKIVIIGTFTPWGVRQTDSQTDKVHFYFKTILQWLLKPITVQLEPIVRITCTRNSTTWQKSEHSKEMLFIKQVENIHFTQV